MKKRIKLFLEQIAQPQGLFIYSKDGYRYLKGAQRGYLVSEIMIDYYYEQLDALQDLYNETESFHTKRVIEDILKIHYSKHLYPIGNIVFS